MDYLIILSWNVRGLGNVENMKNLREKILASKPTVVCIQETKVESLTDKELKELWPNTLLGIELQSALGASGGLATFGNQDLMTCMGVLKWRHFICCRFKWKDCGL